MRIQGSIARQVRSKKTPILSFRPDEVIRSAEHIERVLLSTETLPERPVSEDDPYVSPRVVDEVDEDDELDEGELDEDEDEDEDDDLDDELDD